MKIRLPLDTYELLKQASTCYDLKVVDIFSRAMRKYRNQSEFVATSEKNKTATRMSNPITIRCSEQLVQGLTMQEIRNILHWYLTLKPIVAPERPAFIDVEGVDYIVKEEL